jgi:hypothetical protein
MSNIQRRIQTVTRRLNQLPAEFHREFVDNTPIDTGNARRKTDLRSDSVVADYDYSVRLQEGYSRQAPDGMRDPTIDTIRQRLNRL